MEGGGVGIVEERKRGREKQSCTSLFSACCVFVWHSDLYKERFIEAMNRYFLLVPDCWTSSSIIAFTRNGTLREAIQGKPVVRVGLRRASDPRPENGSMLTRSLWSPQPTMRGLKRDWRTEYNFLSGL